MSHKVVVIAGPARSGKTARLLCAYRQCLSNGPIGGALWISPTHRAASSVSTRLLDGTLVGCLGPNLLTFNQLATRVLAAAAPAMRPMSPLQTRVTLRRLIDEALADGRLDYFAPIAAAPGFLDLLVGFVRELKRLEIWPEELARAQGPRAPKKDRELCGLYQAYQDLLTTHQLYDAQGQFWVARQLLKEDHWEAFPAVRHVFVDGFTDFTRTEHDVLELLAARAESLTISLPWEEGGRRQDVFEKVRLTLEELRRRHPGLEVEQLLPGHELPPSLAHLERGLFGNPRQAQPMAEATDIEILAAAGVTHEIEQIAARIKRLLTDGDSDAKVPAEDILVVFRSLGEVGPLVTETFGRFGIPNVVASAPPLESSPIIHALFAWLQLDAEDWPFRDLLAAIAQNHFQPKWPEWQQGAAAVSLERLVRELEIPSGREALLRSIAWHEERAREALAAKARLSKRQLAAQVGGPLARRIAEALDRLPSQATSREWARAIDDLGVELGMIHPTDEDAAGAVTEAEDREAWQRLQAILAESERLARWTAQPPPRRSRHEFLKLIKDLVQTEALPRASDETGCVRVLSAESVRGLSAPHVFVAGLSERAFPPPNRDDCVYSDADARRWGAGGLPLPSHELRSRFEMLLFYEVVTRATKKLVLSYPALDAAAQPLVASPYLSEVEQACGVGRIPRNGQPHLASVPQTDDVRSLRDFRVRAVANALAQDDGLLGELCAHPSTRQTAANILAGLRASDARFLEGRFGPFEGMLTSPAAGAALTARYGAERCWSPSQLEKYAYCPFQFFMSNVLRLEAVGEPELETDYQRRGQMLHWLLSSVHRELNGASGGHASPTGSRLERFAALVESAVSELRRRGSGDTLDSGLREIDVRKIISWLERYLRQHAAYDQQWTEWDLPPRPAHFEVSFGPRHRDDEAPDAESLPDECDPLSTLEPFELDCGGETIRFAGRIDRIDLGRIADSAVFTVVDYKSGQSSTRTSLKSVMQGQSFQLPLYALAAERLLEGNSVTPFRAAYWHVAGKGYQEKEAVKFRMAAGGRLQACEEWEILEAAIKPRIRSLIEGIRRGQFPMHSADDKCTSYCDYRSVCRVNQVRSLEKHWEPPEVPPA